MDPALEIKMRILEIENLFISFRGLVALNGITFSIEKGEIFGLVGTNGSGKSTLFNCINKLYKPQKGRIIFEERINLLNLPSHKMAGLGIARTFQNLELFHYTKVLDNVMVGLHSRLKVRRFFQSLDLSLKDLLKKWGWDEDEDEAFKILDFLGITRFHSKIVSDLPYGIQKLVELGRALAAKPKLLLLDEPSAGMNEQETMEISRLIKSIREDFGTTILLVEHDMNLVQSICDTLCVLDSGNIISIGTPEEVTNDENVINIFLGEAANA